MKSWLLGGAIGSMLVALLAVSLVRPISWTKPRPSPPPPLSSEESELRLIEENIKPNYPILRFTTADANPTTYMTLLRSLRQILASQRGATTSHGLPALAPLDKVVISNRFILVDLFDHEGATIRIVIDVTNVYFVAFGAGSNCFYFEEAKRDEVKHCFPKDTNLVDLKLSSAYGSLENKGGDRHYIALGIEPLSTAVTLLRETSPDQRSRDEHSLCHSALIIIQMISEAARFEFIETEMLDTISQHGGFDKHETAIPSLPMISLENEWGKFSKQIQMSRGGAFKDELYIERRSKQMEAFDNIALSCPLMSVLNSGTDRMKDPVVHIKGVNNLCMDAKDANDVIISECRFGSQEGYQMWTISEDGTLLSNDGKCLTPKGSSSVTIQKCKKRDPTIFWDILDDGTVSNRDSRLVLSAEAALPGSVITLQPNSYEVRQSWRATNIMQLPVMAIRVYQGLCLEDKTSLGLDSCVEPKPKSPEKEQQRWSLYPDGSIRPHRDPKMCLTCPKDKAGAVVTLESCNPRSSNQRWVFKTHGTIMNLKNNLVLEKIGSPGNYKIVISTLHDDNLNQMWTLAL